MFKALFLCVVCFCVEFGHSLQYVSPPSGKTAELLQVGLQCVRETGTDPGIIVQISNKKYTDDEKVKKFILCGFTKSRTSNKQGDINIDKLLEVYPNKVNKEEIRKVAEECKDQTSVEPMDKVFNFFQCFQEKTPVHLNIGN